MTLTFQSPRSGQICLNGVLRKTFSTDTDKKFQSPRSGQICLNC